MSLYSDFMATTLGSYYSAATGNVDPWTKQNEIDEAAALVQASGGSVTAAQATQTATQDVTRTLKGAGSDPSDPMKLGWFSDLATTFGITNPATLKTLLEIGVLGIVLIFLLWIGFAVFTRR